MATIGIDARRLAGSTGLGNYQHRVIQEVQQQFPGHKFILYTPTSVPPSRRLSGVTLRQGRFGFLPDMLWIQTEAPWMIAQDQLDLYWGTAQLFPFGLGRKVKKLLTVHDIIPLVHPELVQASYRYYMRWMIRRSVQMADHILAISENTKKDLVSFLKVPPEKVTVAYTPHESSFRPIDPHEARSMIRSDLRNRPFFLFVGRVEPRKNLRAVLLALKLLKERHGKLPFAFLAAGGSGWKTNEVLQVAIDAGLGPDEFQFLGGVSDIELNALYSLTMGLVIPTYYEGFGAPLLEAMSCGVPIVTSNRSCCPEVVGEAGILLDPDSIEGIAEAIWRLYQSPTLRQEMASKSLQRAEEFRKKGSYKAAFSQVLQSLSL